MKEPQTGKLQGSAACERRPIALTWKQRSPEDCLRDTGIPLIGRIPWGSHVCLFCETGQDLIDAVSAYFVASCEGEEYCVWIVSDPLTVEDAHAALSQAVPDFAARRASGRFDLISATEWYYGEGDFDAGNVIKAWHARADEAIAKGFSGIRACGNPLWRRITGWRNIAQYEAALDATLTGRRIVMLCAYMMGNSEPRDVLDIACSHQCVVARRGGEWQFLEVPGADEARREIKVLNGDLDILPERLAREGILTERERVVLAQLARGASSKEAARRLGISPRTVDFHRANMMAKLGAKNTAELIGKALSGG